MFKNKAVLSWCLYDVGNGAFSTVVMAVVLPVFYQNIVVTGNTKAWAMVSWGYASSIALLLSAMMTPIIGTYIDIQPVKKRLLALFAGLGILSSAGLTFSGPGLWFLTLCLLITGTVGMSTAAVCYDSLLSTVAPAGALDRVSTLGYGVGYLGGGILLAFDLFLISQWGINGVKLSFISVAVWWTLFSLPLLFYVPEPIIAKVSSAGLRETLNVLCHSWQELKTYPEAFRFLIAFWLYNDGIGTIIRMAAVFGASIGIAQNHLVGALLVTQFVGVPFALVFASLAETLSSKTALLLSLFWYTVIAIGAMFMTRNWQFWAMAIAVGMVQGGSQAISRSLFASMLPASRSGHFFGLYNVSSKFAGIIGPALSGFVGQITGSMQMSIGIIAISFITGAALLWTVDVERGRARVSGHSV